MGATVRRGSSSRSASLGSLLEELRAALGQHPEQSALGQNFQHRGAIDQLRVSMPEASITSASDPSRRRMSVTVCAQVRTSGGTSVRVNSLASW